MPAGRTRATLLLMATTVVVGIGAAFGLVPGGSAGAAMLIAAAVATTVWGPRPVSWRR